MDAAVSLHHHGALPSAVASSLPPHHHHALHLRHPVVPSIPTRLTATAAPSRTPRRSSSSSAVAAAPIPGLPARTAASSSSSTRAATGYAAALADASLRAGTLPRAARHARALLRRLQLQDRPRGRRLEEEADDRVNALVGMLVAKGKGGLVAEVLAEFAAICHHLLPPASASSKRARSASY